MNKQELIDAVATASGESKSAVSSRAGRLRVDHQKEVAGGNKIAWSGFLSFERAHRAERTGPQPGHGRGHHRPRRQRAQGQGRQELQGRGRLAPTACGRRASAGAVRRRRPRAGPARGPARRPRRGSAASGASRQSGSRPSAPARSTTPSTNRVPRSYAARVELEAEQLLDEAVGRVRLDPPAAQRLGELARSCRSASRRPVHHPVDDADDDGDERLQPGQQRPLRVGADGAEQHLGIGEGRLERRSDDRSTGRRATGPTAAPRGRAALGRNPAAYSASRPDSVAPTWGTPSTAWWATSCRHTHSRRSSSGRLHSSANSARLGDDEHELVRRRPGDRAGRTGRSCGGRGARAASRP